MQPLSTVSSEGPKREPGFHPTDQPLPERETVARVLRTGNAQRAAESVLPLLASSLGSLPPSMKTTHGVCVGGNSTSVAQSEPSSRRATPSNTVLTAFVAIGIRTCCLENADAEFQRQDKMTQKILVQRPEEDTRPSGTGVTDDCQLLRGDWGQNLDPLQEQGVFLSAELSVHPHY